MTQDLSTPPAEKQLTVAEAIADLTGNDPGARYYAAWWLGRFRVRDPQAIAALIAALEDESDRSPDGGFPIRRNAARALGKLEDAAAVPGLIECLRCEDFYVREAAAQSLGLLGDTAAVAPLMRLLEGGVAAAVPIPGCPHLDQPYDATIEALGMLQAGEAISLILPFLDHSLPLIQYAAARALFQLTGESQYGDRLVRALAGEQLQLRRAALTDLGAIGYLPAAPAIAQTLAENSLKLIALKGILEAEIGRSGLGGLSEEAVRVMMLMDGLL